MSFDSFWEWLRQQQTQATAEAEANQRQAQLAAAQQEIAQRQQAQAAGLARDGQRDTGVLSKIQYGSDGLPRTADPSKHAAAEAYLADRMASLKGTRGDNLPLDAQPQAVMAPMPPEYKPEGLAMRTGPVAPLQPGGPAGDTLRDAALGTTQPTVDPNARENLYAAIAGGTKGGLAAAAKEPAAAKAAKSEDKKPGFEDRLKGNMDKLADNLGQSWKVYRDF